MGLMVGLGMILEVDLDLRDDFLYSESSVINIRAVYVMNDWI